MMSSLPLTDSVDMTVCQTQALPDADSCRGERTCWSRVVHWVVTTRSHRVICLVLCIWLLNGFDLIFTILSSEQGLLQEENPVARHLLAMGMPSLALYKVGLVLIGSYPLLRFRRARIAEMASLVVLIVYAGLAVRWSTCYEFYSIAFHNGMNLPGFEASLPIVSQ